MSSKIKQKKDKQKKIHRKIVPNYRTYTPSDEQYEVLIFGLHTHIAVRVNKNTTY